MDNEFCHGSGKLRRNVGKLRRNVGKLRRNAWELRWQLLLMFIKKNEPRFQDIAPI
jgi:DNA-binding transcriptional regulator PaaX